MTAKGTQEVVTIGRTEPDGSATRILLVEDSPTQAEAMRGLLEASGYAVTLATSGERGLVRFEAGEFSIVISDIMMPGQVDGYELCRRIKAGPRRDVPVVLLTSLSDPLDIIRGLECGADNFFTKSVEPAHLLERLKLLLTTRESRARSKLRMGVTVFFMNREFTITSEREQILDLLIATFEDAVYQNRELRRREEELEIAKEELSRYASSLEQRLQSVVANVPDVVFSLNVEATATEYISPASRRVLGLAPSEIAADINRWRSAIHPDDAAGVAEAYQRARTSGSSATVEYRVTHSDGSVRWIEETVIPVADQAGSLVRLDGVARDVTQQRNLEEQLRQSQKLEAVGTLAGGVAHDFNNLLAAIRTTTDLVLLDIPPDSLLHRDLTQVAEIVDRGSSLTRQLLAFGRKQMLDVRLLDLSAHLDNTMKMLERIIGEDVRLVVRQTSDPTTVRADPGSLDQVLMNLCVNARDAMPEGGELAILTERVQIDDPFCETHPWARPGNYVRITVSDTGVGMDTAIQSRIFEPFFTTKEMGRGTGLGLAVVYGIVRQHDGLIHVYSEPGKGTTFRIYIPFHEGTPEMRAALPEPALEEGNETILLAEDDAILRNTATRLLERLGYQVIAAADGKEALRLLETRHDTIQLVVLDLVMPGLGGRDVYEQAQRRYPHLRFIFTTGYSPGTAHLDPLPGLPGEVLMKPYGVRALAKAVRQQLDRKR